MITVYKNRRQYAKSKNIDWRTANKASEKGTLSPVFDVSGKVAGYVDLYDIALSLVGQK